MSSNARLDALAEMASDGFLDDYPQDAPDHRQQRAPGLIDPPRRRPPASRKYKEGERVCIVGEHPKRVFIVDYHHGDEVGATLETARDYRNRIGRRTVHALCVRYPHEAYHEHQMKPELPGVKV